MIDGAVLVQARAELGSLLVDTVQGLADVWALDAGRAVILITHRRAGLERMDEIVVLRRGQVIRRLTTPEATVDPNA